MLHYAKCDVIRRQNKKFKLKYLINKTLQRKSTKVQKNLYYSFKYSFTLCNKSFRVMGTLMFRARNQSLQAYWSMTPHVTVLKIFFKTTVYKGQTLFPTRSCPFTNPKDNLNL